MSMAAKLSDLVDKTSGANLQADGHMEVPTQSAKDPRSQRKKIVPLPTHCLGLQPGGCCLAALIQNIVWRYK